MATLIDVTYFGGTLPLIVADNEAAIQEAINSYEPDYLRAALGQSLYDAFIAGMVPKISVVYFSNQFSDQFYKGETDVRWSWLRDGYSFYACGRKYRWPGLVNAAKRSPIANYVYWKYLAEVNPRPTSVGGFADTALENATPVSPKRHMISVWNEMVDWHSILLKLLSLIDPLTGLPVYPEFNPLELCEPESINVYHHQIPA